MIIRDLKQQDLKEVKELISSYWNDPEFKKEVLGEIDSYLKNSEENARHFSIAESDREIIGFAGIRKAPAYFKAFITTKHPAELYIIASKYKRQGIGLKLKEEQVKKAKELGFSEMLIFSPHTHNKSWPFHDTLGFERIGEFTPPEDEIGHVWRKHITM